MRQLINRRPVRGKDIIMKTWSNLAIFVVLLVIPWGMVSAIQFKAEMVEIDKTDTTKSDFYLKDSLYRMEQVERGQQVIILVDQQTNLTRVVAPELKTWIQISSDHRTSLMNDPFQSVKRAAGDGENKPLGTETMNGYLCDIYLVSKNERDLMTQWVSQELKFPLKIINHVVEGRSVKLRNIEVIPVPDSLFQIPDEYEEYVPPKPGEVVVPDWAEEIPTAPVMKPPFEHDMATGEIIRVAITAGRSLRVSGQSTSEGVARLSPAPFLDGKPVQNLARWQIAAAAAGEGGGYIFHESTREANEIVLRANVGEFRVTVEPIEMTERTLAAGEELRLPVDNEEYITTIFTSLSDSGSAATVHFFRDGDEITAADEPIRVGPLDFRRTTIRQKNRAFAEQWSTDGDEIVIRVEKGEMLLKVGQFMVR